MLAPRSDVTREDCGSPVASVAAWFGLRAEDRSAAAVALHALRRRATRIVASRCRCGIVIAEDHVADAVFVMVYGIRRMPRLRIPATTTLAYLCGVARNEWRWSRWRRAREADVEAQRSCALSSMGSASRRLRERNDSPPTKDAHPGYITWDTYLRNQERLRQNQARLGGVVRGAPREGAAVLGGLVICGRCGRRMRTIYRGHATRRWDYVCFGDRSHGQRRCWSVPGAPLDAAVEAVLFQTIVPSEVELALAVEQEVHGRATDLTRQWHARIEQATYEAHRAERRYKAVDPDNRVVTRTLEREWETRLQELAQVERQYEAARQHKHVELTAADQARIRALARDLPAVWRAPTTTPADRQAMLRLVIEAIALGPVEVPQRATRVQVQWHSGTVSEVQVPRPDRRARRRTGEPAVERIRQLAGAGHRDDAIAARLNADGLCTGVGKRWTVWAVRWVRQRRTIPQIAPPAPRRLPLPDRDAEGRYSVPGAAKYFGVSQHVVRNWLRRGLVGGRQSPHGPYPCVWWLEIDQATATRLASAARPPES